MLRPFPALIGAGLAVLWVIGMSVDATDWMTWADGAAAALAFATVGVIPARASSAWAAFCLGAIAASLLAVWAVGLATRATPWLTWWTFVGACLTALVAIAVAVQDRIDRLRVRDVI